MNQDFAIEVSHQALKVMMMLSAPMLLGGLVVGLIVSIFQAVTQINEQTLSFIPKILVIIAAMLFLGPWMMDILGNYTRELIVSIPQVVLGD